MSGFGGAEAAAVDEVERWGKVYLAPDEYRARRRTVWRQYYKLLAYHLFELRTRDFWDFHLTFLRDLGYTLDYGQLAMHAALRVADVAFNPLRTLTNVTHRVAEATEHEHGSATPPPTTIQLGARREPSPHVLR